MKNIAILGSTGSIGRQALAIIDENPWKYKATVLSGFSNLDLLSNQIVQFKPEIAVVANEKDAHSMGIKHPKTQFLFGAKGLIAAASESNSELVLNALVGMRGLEPTYSAVLAGKQIGLANKEALVTGGEIIMSAVKKHNTKMIPVDSEHSAIFQCLEGNRSKDVKQLILTASGGPFKGRKREQLTQVSVSEALNHPKWKMGDKISIDSATLMNKGLEVIEAHWLFDMQQDKIKVIVHPQSIIHSMVEFKDHSILAQLGVADMRIPIGYAFEYPERLTNELESLDFLKAGPLTFEDPDFETFKCLAYAYEALRSGGSYPVVLNAANEELVGLFLDHRINYLDIQDKIGQVLEEHEPTFKLTIEGILEIDRRTRERVKQLCF
jgi:1-deoxy-D-xylulose-5-phosphate reductoisomerase